MQKAAPYTYEGPNGPKTIRLRLGELAGDKHPVTGIPYDLDGFPIFESKGEVFLKEADFKNLDQHILENAIKHSTNK